MGDIEPMRFEFNQGVPIGCSEWLIENVGPGNITIYGDKPEFAWFFERIHEEIPSTNPSMDSNARYVPTITVKDEKMAMLFALRWL